MKKVLFAAFMAFSLSALAESSYTFMGFTKGNKCVQVKNWKGQFLNFCNGNRVTVHVMDRLGASNKAYIQSVTENGAVVSNGQVTKHYEFGSFSVKK